MAQLQIRIVLRGGPRDGEVFLADPDVTEFNFKDIDMSRLTRDHDISTMSDQEFNQVAEPYSEQIGMYRMTDRLAADGNIIFEYQGKTEQL